MTVTAALDAALALAGDTEAVLVGPGALARTPDAVAGVLGADDGVVVVADTITFDVAGRQVDAALRAAGRRVADPIVLPGRPAPHATAENVERVRAALAGSDAVAVAVGAGTVNDLAKRASSVLGRPYLAVATAPSMDGYAAFGAPITVDGFKTSLPGAAPRALVADLDVLAAAPRPMTASGYGDLLGKLPAGACWLVADAVGAEEVDRRVWPFLQEPFRAALDRPEALGAGDPDAFAGLIEGLVLSGLTIQIYGSSRPGSGMEHLLSHLWEMQGLGAQDDPPLSHGQKVGVGSVAAAALYADLLAHAAIDRLDPGALLARRPTAIQVEARVRALLPASPIADAAVQQALVKHGDTAAAAQRLKRAVESWPALREELTAQLLPPAEMQRRLRAVAGPAHPYDIGLSMDQLRLSYLRAQVIRSRYTVLDLAVETGTLDESLDRLFAADGFWGRQA